MLHLNNVIIELGILFRVQWYSGDLKKIQRKELVVTRQSSKWECNDWFENQCPNCFYLSYEHTVDDGDFYSYKFLLEIHFVILVSI